MPTPRRCATSAAFGTARRSRRFSSSFADPPRSALGIATTCDPAATGSTWRRVGEPTPAWYEHVVPGTLGPGLAFPEMAEMGYSFGLGFYIIF